MRSYAILAQYQGHPGVGTSAVPVRFNWKIHPDKAEGPIILAVYYELWLVLGLSVL